MYTRLTVHFLRCT